MQKPSKMAVSLCTESIQRDTALEHFNDLIEVFQSLHDQVNSKNWLSPRPLSEACMSWTISDMTITA